MPNHCRTQPSGMGVSTVFRPTCPMNNPAAHRPMTVIRRKSPRQRIRTAAILKRSFSYFRADAFASGNGNAVVDFTRSMLIRLFTVLGETAAISRL